MTLRVRLLTVLTSALLFTSFLTACSDSADGDPNAELNTREALAGSGVNPPAGIPIADVPEATATANGRTVDMGIGTYCWAGMCVDKVGPVTKGVLDVIRGDVVAVAVPQGGPPLRDVHASAFAAGTPIVSNQGEQVWQYDPNALDLDTARDAGKVAVEVDLPAGTWILSVGMFFEAGDISYSVVLYVK